MKYYSDKTKKLYDKQEELEKAEREYYAKEAENKRLADVKRARAKEIEDARKAMNDATKVYLDKIDAFTKDYGAFHWTESGTLSINSLFDLLMRI